MSKKPVVKKPPKIEWQGYLNVNLTAEQETEFDVWYVANPELWHLLPDVVLEGYKVSFREDAFNDGYSASMYCENAKVDWAGWTLTAWAADLGEALAFLMYKHYSICNQDWSTFRGRAAKTNAKRG